MIRLPTHPGAPDEPGEEQRRQQAEQPPQQPRASGYARHLCRGQPPLEPLCEARQHFREFGRPDAAIACRQRLALIFDDAQELLVDRLLGGDAGRSRALGGEEIGRRASEIDAMLLDIESAQARVVGVEGLAREVVDCRQEARQHHVTIRTRIGRRDIRRSLDGGGSRLPAVDQFAGPAPDEIELVDAKLVERGEQQLALGPAREEALHLDRQAAGRQARFQPPVQLRHHVAKGVGDVGRDHAAHVRMQRLGDLACRVADLLAHGLHDKRGERGSDLLVLVGVDLAQHAF